jgi:hypothetical protein
MTSSVCVCTCTHVDVCVSLLGRVVDLEKVFVNML